MLSLTKFSTSESEGSVEEEVAEAAVAADKERAYKRCRRPHSSYQRVVQGKCPLHFLI